MDQICSRHLEPASTSCHIHGMQHTCNMHSRLVSVPQSHCNSEAVWYNGQSRTQHYIWRASHCFAMVKQSIVTLRKHSSCHQFSWAIIGTASQAGDHLLHGGYAPPVRRALSESPERSGCCCAMGQGPLPLQISAHHRPGSSLEAPNQKHPALVVLRPGRPRAGPNQPPLQRGSATQRKDWVLWRPSLHTII